MESKIGLENRPHAPQECTGEGDPLEPQCLMNIAQVAAYLGLSVRTVYNYRHRGTFAPATVNRRRYPLWSKEDLKAYYGPDLETVAKYRIHMRNMKEARNG